MRRIFVDTSAWAALFVPADEYHAAAVSQVRSIRSGGDRLVTTNYVLTELVALLISPFRLGRPRQIEILDAILTAAWADVIHVDRAIAAAAVDLLRSRPDKMWSLADCSSFVVIREHGIESALTSDHHFEQAGFVRLLN